MMYVVSRSWTPVHEDRCLAEERILALSLWPCPCMAAMGWLAVRGWVAGTSAVWTLLMSAGLLARHSSFGFGSGIIIFGWGAWPPCRRRRGRPALRRTCPDFPGHVGDVLNSVWFGYFQIPFGYHKHVSGARLTCISWPVTTATRGLRMGVVFHNAGSFCSIHLLLVIRFHVTSHCLSLYYKSLCIIEKLVTERMDYGTLIHVAHVKIHIVQSSRSM
jgi:hypothetical protein